MRLASGTAIASTTVATVLFGGVALALNGILHDQVSHSLGGVGAIMVALTAAVLLVIHRWVTDTRTERGLLAQAQHETQTEWARYIAAQASLEGERTRMRRDLDEERAALLEGIAQEREALSAEFEERSASLICETMEATVRMFHNGEFAPDTRRGATLIQFPNQQPEKQPRGHGVVGP
ncbi:hypothetical protein [Streptomyces sp. NPDC012510]|uniref:hypothetical protein n=1 Tax=Streptomyces sp. NPDC012510 TaxID=3364838 RepID=UPI0036E22FCE